MMRTVAQLKRDGDERGIALITVVIATTILAMFSTAIVAYAEGSQHLSRHDQDWNAALAAAEAGIDDYLFRLNENANYWQYSAVSPPPDGNLAFAAWVPVAGGSTEGEFRYTANSSSLGSDGRIRITSTGRVRDSERTVHATLRRRSFLDYLYFTDFETKDPASYTGTPFSASVAQQRCAKYYYGGVGAQRDVSGRTDFAGDSDSSSSYCTDINFIDVDNINGPLHSNDAYIVNCSPNFNGDTSTSWDDPTGTRYRKNSGCGAGSNPNFANPGDPRYLAPLTMPPSNSSIKAETAPGLGGCLYTGPTRIKLNTNGTMTVKSPFSRSTNAACPTTGTSSALPANGVIYVQNVPSISSDPNYTSGCPYSSPTHPLGYPISGDLNTGYGCRNGDVFLEGTLDGQLTIAAENNITIVWDTKYEDGVAGDDLLGLIANNYVEVYHPISCTTSNNAACDMNADLPTRAKFTAGESTARAKFDDADVQAAILSVNHSFWVQQYNSGKHSNLDNLNVVGAIAQRYRGPVGTSSGGTPSTGYAKNYTYDQRLQYLSPPKFLDPVSSAWRVATWAEVDTPAALQ